MLFRRAGTEETLLSLDMTTATQRFGIVQDRPRRESTTPPPIKAAGHPVLPLERPPAPAKPIAAEPERQAQTASTEQSPPRHPLEMLKGLADQGEVVKWMFLAYDEEFLQAFVKRILDRLEEYRQTRIRSQQATEHAPRLVDPVIESLGSEAIPECSFAVTHCPDRRSGPHKGDGAYRDAQALPLGYDRRPVGGRSSSR